MQANPLVQSLSSNLQQQSPILVAIEGHFFSKAIIYPAICNFLAGLAIAAIGYLIVYAR